MNNPTVRKNQHKSGQIVLQTVCPTIPKARLKALKGELDAHNASDHPRHSHRIRRTDW
ncbi:MAG: hypothetical protein IPP59_03535 [Betaproteobacteria bacterium]|nr:hypothetical protein [Candidatus Dechloromonas phosphorivorans]